MLVCSYNFMVIVFSSCLKKPTKIIAKAVFAVSISGAAWQISETAWQISVQP